MKRSFAISLLTAWCMGPSAVAQQPVQATDPPFNRGPAKSALNTKVELDQKGDQPRGPVAEHKALEAFVGTWTFSGQCWAKSDSAPEQHSGTVKAELVLGNRFVKSQMLGTSGNKSIEGLAVCGYDDTKGKYVSTWQDNQCNSIKLDEGTFDPSSKTFTYHGESTPASGVKTQCRRTVRIVSNEEHIMTSFLTEAGKPERKVAELTFRRTSTTVRSDGPIAP